MGQNKQPGCCWHSYAGGWRSQTCCIVVSASVLVLSHTRWVFTVSMRRRTPTVATSSTTTAPVLWIASLLSRLLVVWPSLSVRPILETLVTGPDECSDALHLLTPQCLAFVAKKTGQMVQSSLRLWHLGWVRQTRWMRWSRSWTWPSVFWSLLFKSSRSSLNEGILMVTVVRYSWCFDNEVGVPCLILDLHGYWFFRNITCFRLAVYHLDGQ